MSAPSFHPAVQRWFERALGAPTPPQREGWAHVAAGRHVLIAAPTGSGKTLAAFLATIDALVRESREHALPDETRVLYVSPLKALSHDIEVNLRAPLEGIDAALAELGEGGHGIRVGLRTGDTPAKERAKASKRPPHVFVTTPESLGILLTSASGRRMLSTVRTVIVDEIHAVVGSKRGAHLALSLERLVDLIGGRLQRVGLSATQKPIEEVARFLVGTAGVSSEGVPDCAIVDVGHARTIDLALEMPDSPLEAVMANDVWGEIHARLASLVQAHRTTIVFVPQRRLCERLARALGEILGEDMVAAHHGSMSREMRHEAEHKLKHGEVRCVIATSSLELGIDVGHVDLVCQIGSPRAIAALLQRVGRSGHFLGGVPKGRLFPTSRDDLVESLALLDAIARGELDAVCVPDAPLDVLAQQIIAEVAGRDDATSIDGLFETTRRAWPYRAIERASFDAIVSTLGDAFGVRRGRRGASVHVDLATNVLRPRRGARLLATSSGGAIPDNQSYDVVLEPEGTKLGNIHEDFAVESMPGDIFQLGTASWKIVRVQPGVVRVADAKGQPPTLPFWFGEGPARTRELSTSVTRLVGEIDRELAANGPAHAIDRLRAKLAIAHEPARQAIEYLDEARAALGVLPDGRTVVAERFFDEAANTHLVLHTRFGARVNRAWGLALRKAFCRSFDFELQAAATDDAIVLSLGPTHSFPLDEVFGFLKSGRAAHMLTQAVLDAPLFGTRWRWAATISLAVPRSRGGKKSPPARQRIDAEDLLSVVFPDAQACFENIQGEREVPDHPLVHQALRDCLEDAMDVHGLVDVLARIERGEITCIARDLPQPSALAAEILGARPWAYLDDAPLEERRTQAVMMRRLDDRARLRDLAALDPDAIARVREEAWPDPRDADELHDALGTLGWMRDEEIARVDRDGSWRASLAREGRVTRLALGVWVAAERLAEFRAIHANALWSPAIAIPSAHASRTIEREHALRELVRSRLEGVGPVRASVLAADLAVSEGDVDGALHALEAEGFVMRGRFETQDALEWCERRLLARIHRATVETLRRAIEPVTTADYLRFLFEWQHVAPGSRLSGDDAVHTIVQQLEGFEAPAGAWEEELLASRAIGEVGRSLDALCLSGRVAWARGGAPTLDQDRVPAPVRATRVVLLDRGRLETWAAVRPAWPSLPEASRAAREIERVLDARGASFFHELERATGLDRGAVEAGLAELVARGAVSSDAWSGLRALIAPQAERGIESVTTARRRGPSLSAMESAGRWSLVRTAGARDGERVDEHAVEEVARVLLARWGVIVRRVLEREGMAPPWRELVRVLRRLEARGEIRGGRFVAGQSGEQFALPEALEKLREVRRKPGRGDAITISAIDPLNLVGILTPGARVPAIASHRIVWCDGVPFAVRDGQGVRAMAEGAA
ncbi:DEAD/DEAH box helicase [Sandaracinus amylolyticus]|uniref:DEAD/DEAH box helicase n=1 Tax=Sandaracinus amylolyticus TaxID=927083 RepID=UPI001F4899B8|nr:DEAD/DEAH box helicase [Sandaracinus amylolyticus]UJR81941.1 ATP-dependent RNA helicase YqfR [Sandaracinus amylolyticus]